MKKTLEVRPLINYSFAMSNLHIKSANIVVSHSPKGKAFYTLELFRGGQLVGTHECKTIDQARNKEKGFLSKP